MNFKRFSTSDNQWHDIPHYIHKTSTDTITTLPAVLYPNDTTATVGLKGNMSQTGTPTPTTPIQPQECGERTGNLFDGSIESGGWSGSDGQVPSKSPNGTRLRIDNIFKIDAQKDYTITVFPTTLQVAVMLLDDENKRITDTGWSESNYQNISNAYGIAITTRKSNNTGIIVNDCEGIMISEGSTVPSTYIPYGYKIPISSANTTTPVYLGEVETTRKVKKLVLDGTESYSLQSINSYGIANFYIRIGASNQNAICTHLRRQTTIISQTTDEGYLLTMPPQSGQLATFYMRISSSTASTVAELKEWLAAQYAAGTPVCVWYVLDNPETAVVNEPLRKIGDYADTVSGITIPTIAGADTLSVDTTLQPSEVSVNYKGWHPVADVHEKSRNLFDKSKRTDNSRVVYTTGEIGTLSSVFVSDFTPIEPNTTYMLNIVSSISSKTGHLFALYDENKNFVNTGAHDASSATVVYTFTTPSNVAYIRFNGDMSSVDSTMFNEGSTALPYEPYWT